MSAILDRQHGHRAAIDSVNRERDALALVARAKDVLAKLEDADRKNPASQLIDDLPLFQVAIRREEVKPAGNSKIDEALKALNPDDMTPREALDALYALKKELSAAKAG